MVRRLISLVSGGGVSGRRGVGGRRGVSGGCGISCCRGGRSSCVSCCCCSVRRCSVSRRWLIRRRLVWRRLICRRGMICGWRLVRLLVRCGGVSRCRGVRCGGGGRCRGGISRCCSRRGCRGVSGGRGVFVGRLVAWRLITILRWWLITIRRRLVSITGRLVSITGEGLVHLVSRGRVWGSRCVRGRRGVCGRRGGSCRCVGRGRGVSCCCWVSGGRVLGWLIGRRLINRWGWLVSGINHFVSCRGVSRGCGVCCCGGVSCRSRGCRCRGGGVSCGGGCVCRGGVIIRRLLMVRGQAVGRWFVVGFVV